MHRIAQSWLVLELTGDALLLGLVVAAQFTPMLFLGPWGGVLADRFDRRRILLITQVVMGLQALALAALTLTGTVNAQWVLGAAIALGLATAIDGPARQSIVSDLVPGDEVVNAVALNSANFNAARLVGPALAGLMIAAWGTGWVFLANAVSFAVMFVALYGIRVATRSSGARKGGLVEGLRYVRGRPRLWFTIAVMGIVATLVLNYQITIPMMVSDQFAAGPRSFGVLTSVMALGSLSAALILARRGRTGLRLVTIAGAATSIAVVVAGLMPNIWTFGAALVACGAAGLTMLTSANSYLQTHSDDDHRSRVMALYMAVIFGTTPLAAPFIGAIAQDFGPRWALVAPGALSLVLLGLLAVAFARRHDDDLALV